ncbi:hypothetical protein ES703_50097 [subsurface metagenome]
MPVIWLGYMAAGPETKMYFHEAAAYVLCATTSGAPSVQTPHPAKAVKIDGITPVEAKFGVEMVKAAVNLSRKEANEIVLKLLDKYEAKLDNPPTGSIYQDCCDVTTGRPGGKYMRLYNEIKDELDGIGISF